MDREKALDHAAALKTKRIRVNVGIWSRVCQRHLQLLGDRRPPGLRGEARHQAAAHRHRPGTGLRDGRPQDRRQPPRPGQVRRLCARRRRPLQGPRRPLLDLERAEPERLAVAVQERAEALPLAVLVGLHRDQDRRSQGQGPVRRARAEQGWPHDRAAAVPARRHVLEGQLQGRAQVRAAEGGRPRDPPLPAHERPDRPGGPPRRHADQPAQAAHHGARQARQASRAGNAQQARPRSLPDRVRLPQRRRPQAVREPSFRVAERRVQDRP